MADHRLFAQYVYAPNSLGYCGPADAAVLESVACGNATGVDLTPVAKKFSGAWPYQQIVAEMAGAADPLNDVVVRAYWTGNDLTDRIDREEFGRVLLSRFAAQAGHYWKHLTDGLLDEVAPTHTFHVLGVYPWSRLLDTGAPQPLQVLDSCRISHGTVVEVRSDDLIVRSRPLTFDGALRIGQEQERAVRYRVAGGTFVSDLHVGDIVAVHWDFVCDRLTADEAQRLEYWTNWQLERTNPRLG